MPRKKKEWEKFDAEALFPPPQAHENKIARMDPVNLQENTGNFLEDLNNPFKNSGTAVNAPLDQEHKADEIEDETVSEDSSENLSLEDDEQSPKQKDSEDVDEIAEAASETSEDVHGGSEATKDIKGSPNAADNGMNEDNQGAEKGESGESGKNSGKGKNSIFTKKEDWEGKADQSAGSLKFQSSQSSLDKLEKKERGEKGHRTSQMVYQLKDTNIELETVFKKASELMKKLAFEEDFFIKKSGESRWDVKNLTKIATSKKFHRINSAKNDNVQTTDIVILLDISGSCFQQAEMFLAIAAGCIGSGVRVFAGYNGTARCREIKPPQKTIKSFAKAKGWLRSELQYIQGWHNASLGEWDFPEFVEAVKPKTLLIFGDWDGIDLYVPAVKNPKNRGINFYWFANEDTKENAPIPEGFTRKNYFPGIYAPADFLWALKKVK